MQSTQYKNPLHKTILIPSLIFLFIPKMETFKTVVSTTIFLLGAIFSHAHDINVVNQCNQVLWIGTYGDNGQIPAGGNFRLNPGEQMVFGVPDGWTSGRVWGKTGCDDAGQNCATGNSPQGGRTTFEAVTLAEFGLDKYMGLDFYDISLVDGYNLPMAISPYGVNLDDKCRLVSCNFDFNACPQNFKEYANNGEVDACESACTATREAEYCCPSPPYTKDTCHPSEYSKIFKDQCPDAYSYAYDDDSSTWACRGQGAGTSSYQVIFCP